MGASHAGLLANFVVATLTNYQTNMKPPIAAPTPSSRPPFAAVDTKNLNPQLGLHLPHHDVGRHCRLTEMSFQNDASKEGCDATGIAVT